MLVLSRSRSQRIVIGDDIVITVVDIRGDRVRIGIDAPTDVPIHREEVRAAIQRQQARPGDETGTVERWVTETDDEDGIATTAERPLSERERAELAFQAAEGSQVPPDDDPPSQVGEE